MSCSDVNDGEVVSSCLAVGNDRMLRRVTEISGMITLLIMVTISPFHQATAYFVPVIKWRSQRRRTKTTSLTASSKGTSIGIVGGGLSGLSTAHFLLEKMSSVYITIYDTHAVGQGGASAVAGGLLHPLSPRGKVVHWGLEGFESAAKLVQTALQYRPECVLRTNLYRVALTDQHVDDLQDTARQVPQFCTWVEADDMIQQAGTDPQSTRGGLLVAGLVVHVPTYLEGLWHSCCSKSGAIVWQMVSQDALPSSVSTLRTKHDVVVWAAGAGMLRQPDLIGTRLPIELVRGQSLEFIMPSSDFDQSAVVCGKYVSPLPKPDRVMVGATHEHSSTTMPREQLTQELRQQTESLAPRIWGEGQIDKVISGWRVQSQRTRYGRLPIIGRLKDNEWIFTGLSSRGLLYHGIYGDKLTDMILADDESTVLNDFAHVGWWKNLVTL